MKSIRIRSFSGPYIPACGMNTERLFCPNAGKYRPKKTPNTNTCAVTVGNHLFYNMDQPICIIFFLAWMMACWIISEAISAQHFQTVVLEWYLFRVAILNNDSNFPNLDFKSGQDSGLYYNSTFRFRCSVIQPFQLFPQTPIERKSSSSCA